MPNNYEFRGKSPYSNLQTSSCRLAPVLVLLALFFGLTGCTKKIPREDLPYPLTNPDTFGEEVKVVSVPLPVIGSTPNEGITLGALNAFLLHNDKDEVSTLLAPQVNYNKNFGVSGSLYGALYPYPDNSWEFNIAKSANVNEDYEVRYIDKALFKDVEMNSFLYYFTDGSARFFGFQSTSRQEDETNYGDQERGLTVSVAFRLTEKIQFVVGDRVRRVNIVQGAVKGVPFIRDKFTPEQVPGVEGFFTHAQKLGLVFSTLDSPTFPTSGGYARASAEFSSTDLGSSENYRHYEIEIKNYVPLGDEARYITVFRAAYNQTLGDNVPFLERSILGGETTLRGYGRNRFIDSSYLLINLEERIRLFRWRVFNVNADWEIAPFLDLGAVSRSLLRTRAKNFEFNPGIGFRASVRPNIVGRVDIGFGNEGVAIFVGLGYPF